MSYEFYQNTLTIPASVLYGDLKVMSKPNYNWLCNSGKIVRVREGKGLGNYALIDFESLPERFKVEIIKKLGYPPKKQVQTQILKHYKTDYEAIDFFANYKIEENRTLSPVHQEQYVADAQMLQALDIYMKEMKAFRKSRGGSITKIWDEAAKAVSEVKEQTGHKLPGTKLRLKEKLENFLKDGYSSLVSEKFNWQNAAKVIDKEQEVILRQLFRQYQNFDNEYISKMYNNIAHTLGFPSLSASSMANYKRKFGLTTQSFALGKKAFNEKYKMQVKRKAPEFPMAYWTLDGWTVELLYQDFKDGKTTYHNRLVLEVVLDPCTKYPIGYAIGERESSELIKAALRNAIIHTEELFGFKHQPYQIQADNFAGKIMHPIYRAVAKNFIPTTVGNAQAKIIEPWFKFFNKNYCRTQPNWSGYGVKSKNQPNQDFLQLNRKKFPTKEQAFEQIFKLIETARADVLSQYTEAYVKAPEDLKTRINEFDFYRFLGVKKKDTSKFRGNGLNFSVMKIDYSFDSFDVDFRRNIHLDWDVFFVPENMKKVLVHNEKAGKSFLLSEKYIQPMDLYSQRFEDKNQLKKVDEFNRIMVSEIMDEYNNDEKEIKVINNTLKELGNDTLEKILITDSKGQHKNHLQAQRTAKKLLEKQEAKEQKQEENDWSKEHNDYLRNKVNLNKYIEND